MVVTSLATSLPRVPTKGVGSDVSPFTAIFAMSATEILLPSVFAARIEANWAAVIFTAIDPDKSSRKVGELTVIVGLVPKLDPRESELPAVYREFEVSDEELKSAKLLELIDVNVSEPLDVKTIDEERLWSPGSLKKERLLLLKKL